MEHLQSNGATDHQIRLAQLHEYQTAQGMKIGNGKKGLNYLNQFSIQKLKSPTSQILNIFILTEQKVKSFLENIQSTNRWCVDSASSKQREHLLGPIHPPIHPRFRRLSHVLSLFCRVSQRKHCIFKGMFNFQILLNHQCGGKIFLSWTILK